MQDVADILEARPVDTAIRIIKKGFKTLREKRRREKERERLTSKQTISEYEPILLI